MLEANEDHPDFGKEIIDAGSANHDSIHFKELEKMADVAQLPKVTTLQPLKQTEVVSNWEQELHDHDNKQGG